MAVLSHLAKQKTSFLTAELKTDDSAGGFRPEKGNHPKPTVLYVPQYVANFVSKKSCSI